MPLYLTLFVVLTHVSSYQCNISNFIIIVRDACVRKSAGLPFCLFIYCMRFYEN